MRLKDPRARTSFEHEFTRPCSRRPDWRRGRLSAQASGLIRISNFKSIGMHACAQPNSPGLMGPVRIRSIYDQLQSIRSRSLPRGTHVRVYGARQLGRGPPAVHVLPIHGYRKFVTNQSKIYIQQKGSNINRASA